MLALALLPKSGGAQATGTVVGRVVDSASREPRRGSIATIVATGQTATANEMGRFVIPRVPAGDQSVRVVALGYATLIRPISVRTGDTTTIDLAIARDAIVLGAVRTDASSADRELFESKPNVGAVTITGRAIAALPRLGEADPIRVVQLLPGVQAKNDFSTGFSVRGGESDQNLILIDNYPIYNPFHLGGLFSTFIEPTVRDARLLTGAFPARYGGRLSSVLDIRSVEETRPGLHGSVELSVLASTASVGSSFDDGKGSWMVSGRRTYADKAVRLVTDQPVPYHFRDEQAHLAYELPKRTRLSISVYDGRDVLDGSFAQFTDSVDQGAQGGDFFFSWGNLVAGATLSKSLGSSARIPVVGWRLGDSTSLEQRVSTSRFSTLLDLGSRTATFDNTLSDLRVGGELTAFAERHDRTLGYELSKYNIGYTTTSGQGSVSADESRQRMGVAAVYYEDLWRATPSFLVAAGARVERASGGGRRWSALSPRLSVKFLASRDAAFTAAAGRFSQWTHSLSIEDNPIRLFDLWRGIDSTTPVSTAWQFVAGHERWLPGGSRFARVEAFYKRYDRLLELNLREDPEVDGDEFVGANGTSYGGDLLLRQLDVGPLSGWIAYTYAVSTRRQDTVRYAPAHDRRHDLNIVATWRLGEFVAGTRVGYASGMPHTEIVGQIPRRSFDPVRSTWGGGGGRAYFDDIGGLRNGARYPPTRRIDLFLERNFRVRSASVAPYVSVVNASNAKNVLFYLYDFSTAPATRRTISQFPVLPSAGVSIAF